MARRNGKKPARRLPGITAVSSGGWKWRGVARIDGRQVRGPVRETQEGAYQDHLLLREGRKPDGKVRGAPGSITVGEALDLVAADDQRRGLSDYSLVGRIQDVALMRRQLNPHAPLSVYTAEEIMRYVTERLEEGRAPQTIKTHELFVLKRAFLLAGLEDRTQEVRKRMASGLAHPRVTPDMPFFSAEEIRTILHRMRTEDFFTPTGRRSSLRARVRHADTVQLLASTGIRATELERLRVDDVSYNPCELRIQPKVRKLPRVQPVPVSAVPAVRRLVALGEARGDGLLLIAGAKGLERMMHAWGRRLGLEGFHARALRHSYATILLDQGVPLGTVMELLGHRLVSTTARYVHAISTRRRDAAEVLGSQLSDPSPGTDDPRTTGGPA